jgi:ubiquinone/menaquinone biosynthesis C-methylase UbiE
MTSYRHLSEIYDVFMQDGPQDRWFDLLRQRFQLETYRIADIGCGTGQLTTNLAKCSASVFGVDISEEMLAKAEERAEEERVRIRWMMQDMRELRLPHPVHLAVSVCDSLNYLLSKEALSEAFKRICENLMERGWFCFDMHGAGRVETLREGFWYDVQSDAAVLFETSVNDTGRIRYDVHAFVEERPGLYRRFEEQHEQQFYAIPDVVTLLQECGFTCEDILGDFGQTVPEQADRVIFIARRQ